jgi:polyphenol oxidase
MLYRNRGIVIYCGDSKHALDCADIYDVSGTSATRLQQFAGSLQIMLQAEDITFPVQVHGTDGIFVTRGEPSAGLFRGQADFVITTESNHAIGVVTADCLPLVLYNADFHIVAVIHAGWKGLLGGVINGALTQLDVRVPGMIERCNAVLGPCARKCCYEIRYDLVTMFVEAGLSEAVIKDKNNGKWFLDLVQAATVALVKGGVDPLCIDSSPAQCTLCNDHYNSYRKTKTTMRQPTVAMLL